MAKVEILESVKKKVYKKFKKESQIIFRQMKSLGENPQKGKLIANIAGIIIKEIKYKSFRFYFITDGYKLKCFDKQSLVELLIRFVRMSDKKHQQKTIKEIRRILIHLGPEGLID